MEANDDEAQTFGFDQERQTKKLKTSMVQDATAPLLGSVIPDTVTRDITTNGVSGSSHPSPLQDPNHLRVLPDPQQKPEFENPSFPSANLVSLVSAEHPEADLSDLEDGTTAYQESIEDEEHEKPEPYKSFLPTGYCYDVRMRYHCELEPPKERRELHPEDPRRIFKIFHELCVAGLIENEQLNEGFVIPNPLVNIPVRYVTEAEIELVHDKKMYDKMKATRRELLII